MLNHLYALLMYARLACLGKETNNPLHGKSAHRQIEKQAAMTQIKNQFSKLFRQQAGGGQCGKIQMTQQHK